MGQFHFDVPESAHEFIAQSLWSEAYICGIEGIPWQSRNKFDGTRLSIARTIDASGKLFIACRLDELGYRTLSTCSLRSLEDESYSLPLELARGSCYRARVQADQWERAGLVLSNEFHDLLNEGTQRFLDAAQRIADPGRSAVAAIEGILLLEKAIAELGDSYALQSIAYRKRGEPQIGTLLAASVIPPAPVVSAERESFFDAFNSVAVRLNWADIETDSGRYDYENAQRTISFCAGRGQRIIGGPLIDFRQRLMPHWLYLMEDNFEAFLTSVQVFVTKTVQEFRGSVHLWNCATGLNTPGPIKLDDEQAMRLALGILEVVRRHDPNTPAIMSFDQPFGEYLAKHHDAISPLHFADALARSGLGMAGIGLDFRINYRTPATLPRSAVDFGHLIDRWATLGMPLLVQLGVPANAGIDTNAIAPQDALDSSDAKLDLASEQLRIAGPLIRTLLAKHMVHGIVWDGWSDDEPHVTSHSGLVDMSGNPRPLLEYLTRLRREFLA
jgi:hypothetical protein